MSLQPNTSTEVHRTQTQHGFFDIPSAALQLYENSTNGRLRAMNGLDQMLPPKSAALLPEATTSLADSILGSPTSSRAPKKAKASGYVNIDWVPNASTSPNPSTPCFQPFQDRTNMGMHTVSPLHRTCACRALVHRL